MAKRRPRRITGHRADHQMHGVRKPRCPYCGSSYTPKEGEEDACKSCRDMFAQTGYVPQWDGGFIDKLAMVYIRHFGEYVKASRVLGCTAGDVRDGRKVLARWGFVFEGHRHLGTRMVGWSKMKGGA